MEGFGEPGHGFPEIMLLASFPRAGSALAGCASENWLGGRDSNPDSQIQSLESYRWTTPQRAGAPTEIAGTRTSEPGGSGGRKDNAPPGEWTRIIGAPPEQVKSTGNRRGFSRPAT